jgi:hypothetical protein
MKRQLAAKAKDHAASNAIESARGSGKSAQAVTTVATATVTAAGRILFTRFK